MGLWLIVQSITKFVVSLWTENKDMIRMHSIKTTDLS